MGDRLRLAFGILGNVSSLSLYAAPILTFWRVIKKKSTEGFSCVPYILALFNCFLYTWYGLPVVSYQWENFPLITVNGSGVLLEAFFILTYLWFASSREKMKVAMIVIPLIVVFCVVVTVSTLAFHDHHRRKVFTGSIGLVSSVAMYASPLVAMKQVIQTKSIEFMPFHLSFFSFLTSCIWTAYGLLSHDLVLASPNIIGCPLCMLQLVIYYKYRKRGVNIVEDQPQKWEDVEKNVEKTNQLIAIEDTIAIAEIKDTNPKI